MHNKTEHRRALRGIVFLAFIPWGGAVACPPDAEFEPIEAVWRTAEYELGALKLSEYRACPYGKNAVLDYMLATSLCRIDVARIGVRYFERILASYHLGNDDRRLVARERDGCGLYYKKPAQSAFDEYYSTTGVRSDGFDWVRPASAVGGEPITRIRAMQVEEMQSRLFERSAALEAEKAAAVRLNTDAGVLSTPHLVVAAFSPRPKLELAQIGGSLEVAVNSFGQRFSMPEPEFLFTVYVARDQQELRSLAETIHGLRLSKGSIGYYYTEDRSIAAVVEDTDIAALKHELFHLMVRNDFGDIPPWLDEGLAALFEVTRGEGPELIGLSNWRETVLNELWAERPPLGVLLRMSRAAFDAVDEPRKQAVNYATARYLMLYLQEIGQIQSIYREIRRNDAHDIERGSAEDAVRDLEKVTGTSIDALDVAFTQWFRALAPPLDEASIRVLQTRLNGLGFDVGEADGVYGPRTTSAVSRFQSGAGLNPSGRPNRATLDALDSTAMPAP
jgi:hypothetical protein